MARGASPLLVRQFQLLSAPHLTHTFLLSLRVQYNSSSSSRFSSFLLFPGRPLPAYIYLIPFEVGLNDNQIKFRRICSVPCRAVVEVKEEEKWRLFVVVPSFVFFQEEKRNGLNKSLGARQGLVTTQTQTTKRAKGRRRRRRKKHFSTTKKKAFGGPDGDEGELGE